MRYDAVIFENNDRAILMEFIFRAYQAALNLAQYLISSIVAVYVMMPLSLILIIPGLIKLCIAPTDPDVTGESKEIGQARRKVIDQARKDYLIRFIVGLCVLLPLSMIENPIFYFINPSNTMICVVIALGVGSIIGFNLFLKTFLGPMLREETQKPALYQKSQVKDRIDYLIGLGSPNAFTKTHIKYDLHSPYNILLSHFSKKEYLFWIRFIAEDAQKSRQAGSRITLSAECVPSCCMLEALYEHRKATGADLSDYIVKLRHPVPSVLAILGSWFKNSPHDCSFLEMYRLLRPQDLSFDASTESGSVHQVFSDLQSAKQNIDEIKLWNIIFPTKPKKCIWKRSFFNQVIDGMLRIIDFFINIVWCCIAYLIVMPAFKGLDWLWTGGRPDLIKMVKEIDSAGARCIMYEDDFLDAWEKSRYEVGLVQQLKKYKKFGRWSRLYDFNLLYFNACVALGVSYVGLYLVESFLGGQSVAAYVSLLTGAQVSTWVCILACTIILFTFHQIQAVYCLGSQNLSDNLMIIERDVLLASKFNLMKSPDNEVCMHVDFYPRVLAGPANHDLEKKAKEANAKITDVRSIQDNCQMHKMYNFWLADFALHRADQRQPTVDEVMRYNARSRGEDVHKMRRQQLRIFREAEESDFLRRTAPDKPCPEAVAVVSAPIDRPAAAPAASDSSTNRVVTGPSQSSVGHGSEGVLSGPAW